MKTTETQSVVLSALLQADRSLSTQALLIEIGRGRDKHPPTRSVARVVNALVSAGLVQRGHVWDTWRLTEPGRDIALALARGERSTTALKRGSCV